MAWEPKRAAEASEAPDVAPRDRVTMIGRPQAGKSLLVGSLLRQGRNSAHSFESYRPMFIARGGIDEGRNDTEELIGLINDLVQGKPFPATFTHRILSYRVRLECDIAEDMGGSFFRPWRRSQQMIRRTADVVLTDAAGGLIMGPSTGNIPSDQVRRAQEFSDIVRTSRGLIYCLPVDMTGLDLTAEFKQMSVIEDLIMRDELSLERIVVCLTKYESLWASYGSSAFDNARSPEAFKKVAAEKVPPGLLKLLVSLAEKTLPSRGNEPIEVCVAPVSAYGFVAANGCVNFNATTGRLLVESGENAEPLPRSSIEPPYYTDEEAINYWQPFYIVDPFIYAAFGQKGHLTIDVREIE